MSRTYTMSYDATGTLIKKGHRRDAITGYDYQENDIAPDAVPGRMFAVKFTLGAVNTAQTFNVPSGAKAVRLTPVTAANYYFNVNGAPPAGLPTSSAGAVFTFGANQACGVLPSGASGITRYLADNVTTFQLAADVLNAVVVVEFF